MNSIPVPWERQMFEGRDFKYLASLQLVFVVIC